MMTLVVAALASTMVGQAQPRQPNWTAVEAETLEHFQALLRFDTSDPPGGEKPAAEYLKQVLEKEGIPVQTFALEPHRPNVVARLKGNGTKRPILMMAHTDVVNVDAAKWTFPPFSATRSEGYVYGRGSVDDKDNVVTSLMTMLLLKRLNVPLDRDVIFLAEAGEEGSTRVGIQYMVNQHFPEIDGEYCLAEGGGVTRKGGKVAYASVQTVEKIPRAIELTSRGISGHGSVPLLSNAVVHLSSAIAKFATWRAPLRLNETTRTYFERLATVSSPEDATRYRSVAGGDPQRVADADQFFVEHEPRHAAMVRTTVSPNIIQGGYRLNVIPSEAKASLDVRLLPDEDPEKFLEMVRGLVNDPAVQVAYAPRDVRPPGSARLDSEAFKTLESSITRHYKTVTLPTMSTGATDMAYLRAKGVQCYGIGPATDIEDGPKGFGAHSDQERILESELHRFVRFNWDVVSTLARSRPGSKALSRQ
jgi:acetylornithine deacetylase/succinyl-diaminopimelate desuccinylase-like protein